MRVSSCSRSFSFSFLSLLSRVLKDIRLNSRSFKTPPFPFLFALGDSLGCEGPGCWSEKQKLDDSLVNQRVTIILLVLVPRFPGWSGLVVEVGHDVVHRHGSLDMVLLGVWLLPRQRLLLHGHDAVRLRSLEVAAHVWKLLNGLGITQQDIEVGPLVCLGVGTRRQMSLMRRWPQNARLLILI